MFDTCFFSYFARSLIIKSFSIMVTSQKTQKDPNKIEGIPSKELFINMLVKDITLKDAIGDLVDNSVDAAHTHVIKKDDLSPFSIRINIDKTQFEIIDNAGGIEVEVAKESAFKLGKPKDYKIGDHTIGQFGIGMKRAFFKIGEKIAVESVAINSSFKITIPVQTWKNREDENDWDFAFDSTKIEKSSLKDTQTKIVISELKEDAKKQFADPKFLIDLKNEIALEHLFAINSGLNIIINKEKLKAPKITLIYQEDIVPCYWKHTFSDGLTAEIIAGVSEDSGEEGGWYVFCNERLILGPDTSEVTGWTGGKGKANKGERKVKELPKYHDQFFRFRGYVFFNAKDSSRLPWNTSKTGMDKDSPHFIFVRTQMIIMAKQVKSLMDDLKKEREKGNPKENQILNNRVETARIVSVKEVLDHKGDLPAVYMYPKALLNPIEATRNALQISFSKPKKEVLKVMQHLGVDDPNVAGSLAFDYFVENET